MKNASKGPAETPDPKAFERMKEFTRRLIAVPKLEIPTPKKPKARKRH